MIILLSSLSAECTQKAKEKSISLYNQSYETLSSDNSLTLLKESLKSCYSAVVACEINLRLGDNAFDAKEYQDAKSHYATLSGEIDHIKDRADKKRYLLIYYKRMQELYATLKDPVNENIMKEKYNITGGKPMIYKSYVDSDDIKKQLNPSEEEKGSLLRGAEVAPRSINLSITFLKNKTTLTSEGKRQAKALKKALQELQRENTQGKITIIGYTDTDGMASYNQSLSQRRAKYIRDFVQKNNNLSIITKGRGERSPICADEFETITENNGEYSCADREDKFSSRRVEIKFQLKK